ncbi:hypothetical protein C1Y40_02279 [Mycobacterium talmoniae]|uniref:Uncharacterized protein n=1 Tax=Mycobacterium talmoniae TaxID=1858794 RepID=A0A2S8BLE3_9MYCO|nr:hypothetical protein C1Y40_02279 [Mycobacterium talmoniae]
MPTSVATSSLPRLGGAGGVEHAAGGQDLDPVLGDRAFPGQVQRRGRATALRVHEQFGVGVGARLVGQLVAVDAGVHVTFAGPHVQVLPPGHPAHMGAEELVGAEQHLTVGVDGGDHVDGVRRGAAHVGERLDRGGGVDVGHHRGVGVLVLPSAQLLGGDRVGQRAPGPLVGDQHGLVRAQNLGGLGHEVHAAEHDGVLGGVGGDPRQRQRITDVVGDILDGGQLVVVRQHGGVACPRQAANLGGPLLIGVHPGIAGGRVDDAGGQAVRRHNSGHGGFLSPNRFSTYNRKHAVW